MDMTSVSESFLLEDCDDPVAISTFVNSDNYEVAMDEQIADSLVDDIDTDDIFDDDFSGTFTDILNEDIDDDIEVDADVYGFDGDIIDIVDGLI